MKKKQASWVHVAPSPKVEQEEKPQPAKEVEPTESEAQNG